MAGWGQVNQIIMSGLFFNRVWLGGGGPGGGEDFFQQVLTTTRGPQWKSLDLWEIV